MATHLPKIKTESCKENMTSLLPRKGAAINSVQPIKRGALGEVGNKLHSLHNGNETLKPMGEPQAHVVTKKRVEVKKRVPVVSKPTNPTNDRENATRLNGKILLRQESLIIPKPLQNVKKNTTKPLEMTITEKTKAASINDPDKNTRDDPQMVTEYIEDILSYVQSIEDLFPIKKSFLEGAKVTPKMRATLVNWLVDAHRNFTMGLESLHLCISIVDRYLQVNKAVDRSIFQLVGTAALLLAAKYEEVHLPDIEDFVFICDDTFTKKQILQMEIDMVKKLDFRMGWPLSIFFLRRYSKIAEVTFEQHTLAKYILELALLEYNLAHVKPSIQAAAACCLSVAVVNQVTNLQRVWTPTLVHYTKYKYLDFKPVIAEFARMIVRAEASNFDTVRQKYSTSKYGKISLSGKLQGPVVKTLLLLPSTLN